MESQTNMSERLYRTEVYRGAVTRKELATTPNLYERMRRSVEHYLHKMGIEPAAVMVAGCYDQDDANKHMFEISVYADLTKLERAQIEVAGGVLLEY